MYMNVFYRLIFSFSFFSMFLLSFHGFGLFLSSTGFEQAFGFVLMMVGVGMAPAFLIGAVVGIRD